MWAPHNRDRWADLDALEEPTDVGRRLDAGGFILADPFETILRTLSIEYLRGAWERVSSALTRYHLAPIDLSWGCLHPGVTRIKGLEQRAAPSDYTGWTSRALSDFFLDRRYHTIDAELAQGRPALRCACSWRSGKWNIAPNDFALGLGLIEALATDEISDWAPAVILKHAGDTSGAWIEIAQALDSLDQDALDQALVQARSSYSLLGYRIVIRGFAGYIRQPGINMAIQFPEEPNR
ncbi:MAG TPA: hypothetical protein VHR15_07960 [Ktedonobacterales bacterium]|jgi:hypothetical protein|nr:hypothetical protein [Ktedonobacterales bacterium]